MGEFFISIAHNSLFVKYFSSEKQYIVTSMYRDTTIGKINVPKQTCKMKNSVILACIKISITTFLNELKDDEILNGAIEFKVPDASEMLMGININSNKLKPDKSIMSKEKYKRKLSKMVNKVKREKLEEASNVAIDFLNLINDAVEYKENQDT